MVDFKKNIYVHLVSWVYLKTEEQYRDHFSKSKQKQSREWKHKMACPPLKLEVEEESILRCAASSTWLTRESADWAHAPRPHTHQSYLFTVKIRLTVGPQLQTYRHILKYHID